MNSEEWKLLQRQSLLRDWYGRDFGDTEMAAHTPAPEHIGKFLDDLMTRAAGADAADMDRLRRGWDGMVGAALALHTFPIRFQLRTLVVGVDHPAWQMEVRRMKRLLAARVNEFLGRERIRDVTFVSAAVKP